MEFERSTRDLLYNRIFRLSLWPWGIIIILIYMRYFIVEQGEYSDFSVSIIEAPENITITRDEIEELLNIDAWSHAHITGEIIGEVKEFPTAIIKATVEERVNSSFCCYENRKYKTVLDREYTKDELLKIANENDSSGSAYWDREIDKKYKEYKRAYELLKKL